MESKLEFNLIGELPIEVLNYRTPEHDTAKALEYGVIQRISARVYGGQGQMLVFWQHGEREVWSIHKLQNFSLNEYDCPFSYEVMTERENAMNSYGDKFKLVVASEQG